MGALRDLTGMRFGHLFVIGTRERRGIHLVWLCRCDCGREKWVLGYDMWQGKTRSCGCMQQSGIPVKHGHARKDKRSRTYVIWKNMIARCHNTNLPQWKDWGGRGIQVAPEWIDFRNFLKDMGECPPGKFIDRINNEGHYEPGNCHWVSRIEQNNNKRNNLMIEYQNQTKSLAQWCRELNLPYSKIYQKIHASHQPPSLTFGKHMKTCQSTNKPSVS